MKNILKHNGQEGMNLNLCAMSAAAMKGKIHLYTLVNFLFYTLIYCTYELDILVTKVRIYKCTFDFRFWYRLIASLNRVFSWVIQSLPSVSIPQNTELNDMELNGVGHVTWPHPSPHTGRKGILVPDLNLFVWLICVQFIQK